MNRRLVQLARSFRRYKRSIVIAVVTLLVIGWGDLRYRAFRKNQPAHAKQPYDVVHRRAAEVCAAMGTECQLDPHPIFVERKTPCYPNETAPMSMWKFMCLVDGRVTWMMFNDDNAGLAYVIAERNHLEDLDHSTLGRIKTRGEAAEEGFQRLKMMKLLGHGSMVALRNTPHLNPLGNLWEMIWSVKRDAHAEPYTIRMELDSANGTPISLVDNSKLRKPDRS